MPFGSNVLTNGEADNREPNKGLELTAYSIRSFLAPASSSSSGPALASQE
jgi:hypothetical protein